MLNSPIYIPLIFGIATLITVAIFHYALIRTVPTQRATAITFGLVLWSVVQSILALIGFYTNNLDALPPRIILILAPTLLVILWLFSWKKGREFINQLPLVPLTYLSIIRIPVEIVLYWLYLHQAVPELMTFAGRNFDILAGITAPFAAYFGLQQKIRPGVMLIWNIVSLGLLLFIIANAILSAPTPIQKFGFDQPNVALLYFPFVLLPAVVVPVVLFSHLVALRQMLFEQAGANVAKHRSVRL